MSSDFYKPSLDLRGLLNDTQYEAATHLEGPLLIVAGAGSGKTRTLVHRVAWLIDQGMEPSSILLLTFTRKAASEMLSRCEKLVGSRVGRVSGGTFHSLAHSILRIYAPTLGFTNSFGIMDQDDSESLIGRLRNEDYAAKNHDKFPKRSTIQNIFSQSINKDTSVGKVIAKSYKHLSEFESSITRIFKAYQTHKLQNDLMDFDDLLVFFERLMVEHEHIRHEIASRYNYILVDEYQDTNAIQARLTAHLGLGHRNVTAVGDEAQSIYAFRGANFQNIMDFPRIFDGTKILKLEDNYRSRPQILNVANHLLSQAKDRYEKVLRPNRTDGPLNKIILLSSTSDEALTVSELISTDLANGIPLKDIAVLFRAGSHSFELEAQLTRRRIPYTKYGGRKFLELAHTKDFLCYLRLSVNKNDGQSLRRVLSHIKGLGPKGQENVAQWALPNDTDNAPTGYLATGNLLNSNSPKVRSDYISVLDQAPVTKDKARKNLIQLKDLLNSITIADLDPQTVVEDVYQYYSVLLPDLYPDDYPDRMTDLLEIKGMASQATDLVTFLADLTLDPPNNLSVGRGDRTNPTDLTLSTIHSAKGLEWARVYLISAVEGRFPSSYSKADDIEEELRLMYVAVTRACDQLVITMPVNCQTWGNSLGSGPTRFLVDINPKIVEITKNGRPANFDSFSRSFEHLEEVFRSEYSVPKKPIEKTSDLPSAKRLYFSSDETLTKKKTNKDHNLFPNDLQSFAPGQKVNHPVFGPGSIMNIRSGTATIDFDQFGFKSVILRYAKLTILES